MCLIVCLKIWSQEKNVKKKRNLKDLSKVHKNIRVIILIEIVDKYIDEKEFLFKMNLLIFNFKLF